MKIIKKLVVGVLLSAVMLALSGCFDAGHPDSGRMPWAKPASWEGTKPGLSY